MLKKSILVIDPIKNVLDVYRMILEEKGYVVDMAINLEEALHLCILNCYSIIITEYFTPLEKMHHFIRSIKESTLETYQIMSTRVTIDDLNYKKLFDMGLDDLLVKPYGREKLLAHIEKGIKRQNYVMRINESAFQYYTFPNQSDIPEFLSPLLAEIDQEFPSS